jgi:light-regulated signal transduction histidine kinase (bacteriophytochrome)
MWKQIVKSLEKFGDALSILLMGINTWTVLYAFFRLRALGLGSDKGVQIVFWGWFLVTVLGGLLIAIFFGAQRKSLETERKSVGILEAYSAELERSNRELNDFASVAAHDLQEPLRKIQAFGDLLFKNLDGQLPGESSGYLKRMLASAGRMQDLIADLLDYSRINSKPVEFQDVDLNTTLKEVLSDLEVALAASKAEIKAGPLPSLQADPIQMRQVFQNLIGNALKFHKPGEAPRLSIEARAAEGKLTLSFKDQGIGFDNRHLERIFAIFQRLHGRGAYEGNGVGLAVCRRIAERHGGQMSGSGREGEGAEFWISLPLMQNGVSP